VPPNSANRAALDVQKWLPRSAAPLFLLLLLGVNYAALAGLHHLPAPTPVSQPAHHLSLHPHPLSAAGLAARAGQALLTPVAKTAAALLVMMNTGYVYTNYVTTARPTVLLGRHGDLWDLVVINAALPYVMAVAGSHNAEALFPARSEASHFADSAATPASGHASSSGGGGHTDAVMAGGAPTAVAASTANVSQKESRTGPGARGADTQASAVATWFTSTLAAALDLARSQLQAAGLLAPLLATFVAGLHIPYLTRWGICDRSMSAKEIANATPATVAGAIIKGGFILACVAAHLAWAAQHGPAPVVARLAAFAATAAALTAVTVRLSRRYYFHFHHWFLGLLLTCVCVMPWGTASAMSLGLALSQFVEGAGRWGCAPLWHKL
jgi:hypothetical protein